MWWSNGGGSLSTDREATVVGLALSQDANLQELFSLSRGS